MRWKGCGGCGQGTEATSPLVLLRRGNLWVARVGEAVIICSWLALAVWSRRVVRGWRIAAMVRDMERRERFEEMFRERDGMSRLRGEKG